MDKSRLIQEQKALAQKLILTDAIEESAIIAGASSVYTHDTIISVIIVYDIKENKVIEKKFTVEKEAMPFHKDFICYRECSSLIKTFHALKNKPSLVFIEGVGILHPQKMGIASYFGLFADIPTIGVSSTKNFGMQEGDAVYYNKEILAKILITKENARPIYVSQGHKISLSTAIEKTKSFLLGHKLPEPVYLAHKYAAKIKGGLRKDNNMDEHNFFHQLSKLI
ncbi:endonuclease V [Candidatus Woesearchaeota archaeon]|nr:endonuclease V [Candidatus Woesearchaeota archaeon]